MGLLLLSTTLAAEIHVNPGDDFETLVASAAPGDELIFHAGDYQTTGFWGVDLQGTVDQPIVIRVAEGEAVSITGIASQNTIDISGSYYTFAGFEIIGGSHGVRVGSSSHAVFEELHIHDTGDVGLSCNRPDNVYDNVEIRRVHIHHTAGTGECMYLGCNDGACTMHSSIVEFNWCHDTKNSSQGDGIELKTGSYGVTIRHNVIHDVNYPGITMYGTQGQEGNLVEGNLIWNVVDNGIQTVGDVIVRNNVVFFVGGNGIHAKPSQGEVPANLEVVHNTVVGAGAACFRGNDWPAANGNLIAGNGLFCEGGTAVKLVNAPDGTWMQNGVIGALDGLGTGTFDLGSPDAELVDPAAWHAYPQAGSALIDAVAGWADEDFNCLPREDGSPDAGAYEHMGRPNPGWIPEPGFKECAGDPGDGDGDTGDGDGDTGTGDGDTGSGDGDGDTGSGSESGLDGGTELGESGGDAGLDESGGCSCSSEPGGRGAPLALGLSLLVWIRRRRGRRGGTEA